MGRAQGDQFATGPSEEADKLRALCREYLSSRHTTTWGKSFTVTSSDGLDNAVEFLATAIEGVMAVGKDNGMLRVEQRGYVFEAERPMRSWEGCREVVVTNPQGREVDRVEVDGTKPMTVERLTWIGKEWLAMLADATQGL